MSDLLRLLFTKEQQRAIQSGRFLQKSNRERLAQVALYKRAMWANHAWFEGIACKKDRFAGKIHMFHMFLTVFPLFMPKSESLPSLFPHTLFFKEQFEWFAHIAHYKKNCEQFAQVAHDKIATLSNLLRSLMTKEWWEQFALFFSSESLFHSQKGQIARKLDERISNLDMEWEW